MANGRIQGTGQNLAQGRKARDDCSVQGGAFDQDTGELLVTSRRGAAYRLVGLSVVGSDGPLADLSAPTTSPVGPTKMAP